MDPAPQLPLSLDTCSANDVRKWRGWEQRFCVRKRRQKTAGYTHEQRRPSLSLGPNEARSSTSPAFRSPAERRKGRGGDALSFPDDKTAQAPPTFGTTAPATGSPAAERTKRSRYACQRERRPPPNEQGWAYKGRTFALKRSLRGSSYPPRSGQNDEAFSFWPLVPWRSRE